MKRSSALALVVFGVGAGLRPGELVALRGTDVTRHGRQVVVSVSGPAARVVPVTAGYADRAWELARRAGSDFVFRPGPADRGYKNFVSSFTRGLAADPAAPRLSLRRARSSFICHHLAAGTPVPVLLAITGIAEAGSLARYARQVGGHQLLQGRPAGALARGAHPVSGDGLNLPPAGGVSDQTVAFATELIDRSGKAPVIEAALARRTGRPRPLPVRAVLAALLCLALDDRPLFLTEATRLLFCQLSPSSRRLLKVTGTVTTQRAFLAAYRRVRYCFGAICSVMDPSALPKNRRLTQDDLKARTRPMAPGQAEAARGRLEAFLNALIEASISALTGEEHAAYDGCTGLDATPVPLFSRGPSKRTGLCASDPDGGWYVREGDHREREDDKGKPLRKIAWALEATIATMARPPGAPPAHPNLAAGLALTRPGEDPGGTGARVLASLAARGHKTGSLGYDRAYTQALPERFHLPARALGYYPVMDYRADQLGIQANTGGALLVEGTWYCPALPGPLITATTRLRGHAITRDLYDQQITARRPYQLKHKDGPDTDGYQRLSCPAAGNRPRLICPLRQASLTPRDGRAKVLQPPPEPPRICRQTAITIAPDTGARYRQDLPYGSPAWHAPLRHLAEHHRRPQRAHQRPRPRSPRPARPAPRPRHRRPVHLHRAAADGREHPQDPRLARPHRPRQGPHHPARTTAAGQPARLPPRRLTGTSSPRHLDTFSPAGQPRPRPARSTRNRPAGTSRQAGQQ